MPNIAISGSAISGSFTSEHNGHYDIDNNPIHTSGGITGKILSGSDTVFVNGRAVATVGSTTDENDACCSYSGITSHGTVSSGSAKVFIKGKPVARVGDSVSIHCHGYASITTGDAKVNIV